MPTRPKKTAASKPPADIVTTGGFEPVRITTKKTKQAASGTPLFYIDDTPYYVPAKVPQSVVLEYLRLTRTSGDMIAGQRLLERLLGPDAYEALEQSEEIDDNALEQIMSAAIHHLVGNGESGN